MINMNFDIYIIIKNKKLTDLTICNYEPNKFIVFTDMTQIISDSNPSKKKT